MQTAVGPSQVDSHRQGRGLWRVGLQLGFWNVLQQDRDRRGTVRSLVSNQAWRHTVARRMYRQGRRVPIESDFLERKTEVAGLIGKHHACLDYPDVDRSSTDAHFGTGQRTGTVVRSRQTHTIARGFPVLLRGSRGSIQQLVAASRYCTCRFAA